MRDYFYALAERLQDELRADEHLLCRLAAEESDFVRFNRGAIRQPGHVRQIYATVTLIKARRQAAFSTALTGAAADDRALLARRLAVLREQLSDWPEDPYLLIAREVSSTEQKAGLPKPAAGAIVDDIMALAEGRDFVGILAAGPIYRGFANSHGQRNWHETVSFNLDWSLYHGDKAVKARYAGFEWSRARFEETFQTAVVQLQLLTRQPVTPETGVCRAYLAPAAVSDIVQLLNWRGFSEKALRTRRSPLNRMRDEDRRLDARVTLSENLSAGLSPGFQQEGFIKPQRITLIERGRLSSSLVSPRTAQEYGLAANGADDDETLSSIDIEPGNLPLARVLAELGTGIFVGNLWYLNYSDRLNGRMTGMTRFATFWVENGELKAPVNPMRFDDSCYRLLGENLLDLTAERELLLESEAYGRRSTNSVRLPGILVKSFNLVL